jgi:hypothetical protein
MQENLIKIIFIKKIILNYYKIDKINIIMIISRK